MQTTIILLVSPHKLVHIMSPIIKVKLVHFFLKNVITICETLHPFLASFLLDADGKSSDKQTPGAAYDILNNMTLIMKFK
jgi:hypothetical protein